MKERRAIIYGLCDPRSGELRYVGKSTKGLVRCASHVCPSSLRDRTRKNGWIRSLLAVGLKPEAFEIEKCEAPKDLDEAERHHIAQFRALGCRLTNMTDGGDGQIGIPCSLERKEKIGAAQRGKPKPKHTEEWKRMMSERMTGRTMPAEAVARAAAKRRGQKRSPAVLAVLAARAQEQWARPGYAEKMSRAHGGVPFTDQFGRRYETISEAARTLGLAGTGHISAVLNGKRKHTHGYIFTRTES